MIHDKKLTKLIRYRLQIVVKKQLVYIILLCTPVVEMSKFP